MSTPPRFPARVEAGRLLATLAAWGAAVTMPVLGVFGSSPETFVFRRADASDLVWFAAMVGVLAPVAIWAAGALAGLAFPRRRPLGHAAVVGVLAAVAVAQAISDLPGPIVVAAAAAVAMVTTSLLHRHAAVRLWSQLMVAVPVLAIASFLLWSDAADAVRGGSFEPLATNVEPDPTGSSVIVVVLDELPTASIVDASGAIDRTRFPQLARLGDDATWYRNATTVAGWTVAAVPSILTGRLAGTTAPLWTEQPDNLFRLLAPTHDLVVSESLTRLCPVEVCGERPSAPVPVGSEPAPPERVDADRGALLRDAVDVLRERLTGEGSGDRFDDFVEELVEDVVAPEPDAFGASGDPTMRSEGTDTIAQPRRWQEFLAALEPADRPVLGFVHVELPHQPWILLPDGTSHGGLASIGISESLHGDAWTARVARQLHLLQAGYADALVGELLDHLDRLGLYDDAMVVVVADHGVAFGLDRNVRTFAEASAIDIAWVPMLVKRPAQRTGSIDDRPASTIDLLPTIAAEAGVEPPWPVDGGDLAQHPPDDADRIFQLLPNLVDGRDRLGQTTLSADGVDEIVARSFPDIETGEDPIAGLYRGSSVEGLVGTRPDIVGDATPVEVTIDGTTSARTLVLAGGRVDAGPETPVRAVVGLVDGTVVAASPPTVHPTGATGFLLVFPIDSSIAAEDVDLALVLDTTTVALGALVDR